MIFRILGVFALCMVPVGVYLFFYLKRTINFYTKVSDRIKDSRKKKIIFYIILILVIVLIMSLCINVFSLRSMIMLHIVAAAVVIDIINLVYRRICKKRTGSKVWDNIYRCGLLPLAITTVIIIYGMFNMTNVKREDYTIYTDKQIQSEGYTIALISDLHLGNSMDADKLRDSIEEIEKIKPDMIVLCGDLFDESTKLSELQKAAGIFGEAESVYGTFYVYGNHDKSSYARTADYTPAQLRTSLLENGVHILADEVYQINDEFVIVGREDARYSGMLGEASARIPASELINRTDKDDFILLLDHQPLELESNSKLGYDLQLSGHTHGGQIWPVGLISDLLGFGELNYGYKQIDDFQIIVSSGIGGWGYPIRTGSQSEYVIVKVLPAVQ